MNYYERIQRAIDYIDAHLEETLTKEEIAAQAFMFERMNIMNKYYDEQDPEMQEKYPDIVVIKDLPEMTVVSARYVGKNPEQNALSSIQKWFSESGLNIQKDALRIFGFNNPNPKNDEDQDYGYEIIVTVPDAYQTSDKTVEVKIFPGGKYAVCGISGYEGNADGAGIPEAWDKLTKWLAGSKYVYGHHQWLEEHLNFSEDFSFESGMDLYMPIKLK